MIEQLIAAIEDEVDYLLSDYGLIEDRVEMEVNYRLRVTLTRIVDNLKEGTSGEGPLSLRS